MKQQNEGAEDIYAVRKKKKRKRILMRSIWFLLLAAGILILYQKRNVWIPKLDEIGTKHQNHLPEDAEAAEGNFPIYVYGNAGYQTGTINRHLLVLSDSYLQIYSIDGALTASRQHTYGSAVLQTAGNYALVYEDGGTRFRLETTRKTQYEKTVPEQIIFGRVSESGLTAIVTTSETSACRIYVFNAKGQQIYERSCIAEIAELTFHPDDGGCYAVSLQVENGIMKSVVHSYSFSQTTDIWSSEPLDMLAISVYNTKKGDLFVLGDTRCCFLNENGAVSSTYIYPDTLRSADCADGTAVLLLANDEKRTESLVILNGDALNPIYRNYDKEVKCIGLVPESSAILVQLRSKIETLRYDGALLREVAATDNYESFLRIDAYLFMQGYHTIDRISYHTQ